MRLSFSGDPGPKAKLDQILGFSVLGLSFSLGVIASLIFDGAPAVRRPSTTPPTIDGVVGWPSRVDPIRSLTKARQLARPLSLRGIVIKGVDSDGLIDLTGGSGSVRYAFQGPPGAVEQEASRSKRPVPRCKKLAVRLDTSGMVADSAKRDARCPKDALAFLPAPRCGPRQLWERARQQGAPEEMLATVEYYMAATGPAWRFTIPGVRFRLETHQDCLTPLKPGSDASSKR